MVPNAESSKWRYDVVSPVVSHIQREQASNLGRRSTRSTHADRQGSLARIPPSSLCRSARLLPLRQVEYVSCK